MSVCRERVEGDHCGCGEWYLRVGRVLRDVVVRNREGVVRSRECGGDGRVFGCRVSLLLSWRKRGMWERNVRDGY